jgi:hypothetical protein
MFSRDTNDGNIYAPNNETCLATSLRWQKCIQLQIPIDHNCWSVMHAYMSHYQYFLTVDSICKRKEENRIVELY